MGHAPMVIGLSVNGVRLRILQGLLGESGVERWGNLGVLRGRGCYGLAFGTSGPKLRETSVAQTTGDQCLLGAPDTSWTRSNRRDEP